MIQALVPLLVLGALGTGIWLAVAGRSHAGPAAAGGNGGGGGDLREQVGRLFRLGLLFGALVFAAEGVVGLVARALPTMRGVPRDPADLALALSFTIVGLPALAGLAAWTRSRLRAGPDEARSVPWAGYLGLTLLVALLLVLTNASITLSWALGLEPFSGPELARTIVWGGVLAVHWVLNRRRPLVGPGGLPEERTPVYLLAGSLVGLVMGGFGSGQLLRTGFRLLYDRAADLPALPAGAGSLKRPAITAGLGLAVWLWFWLLHARRAPRTGRWYVYVLLGGVLGGLVTTLVAAGTLLHAVLQWTLGDPGRTTAALYFRVVPPAAAALAVGATAWIHHRRTLSRRVAAPAAGAGTPGATGRRGEAERVYDHLVALVGLTVCAAAVTLVVAALVAVVVGASRTAVPVANPVVLAATFVLVGGPVWLVFWRRVQHLARTDAAELRSPSRRLYVLVALGVSGAVALVSLVVLLNGFLNDVTASRVSSRTLLDIRVPLGLVVSAAVVAAYHGVVYRRDRAAVALADAEAAAEAVAGAPVPPPPAGLQEVVLISDLTPADSADVAGALGHRVLRFTTAAAPGPRPDTAAVARAVADAESLGARRALVTIRQGRIEVEGLQDE